MFPYPRVIRNDASANSADCALILLPIHFNKDSPMAICLY